MNGAMNGAGRAVAALSALFERVRQRRLLLALANDASFLKDVGLSRVDALHEAEKPFWRS